jgi:L-alanine-DL-glutamate epimerase-like enolase superfamily enzyme
MTAASSTTCAIEGVDVEAFTIPTDAPESDGTLEWSSTTLVLVTLAAGGRSGIGWTYGPAALRALVADPLRDVVHGGDPFDGPGLWDGMVRAVRNAGPWGLAMYAVSAVDIALWDLRARLLGVSVGTLLGRCRDRVAIYGSGGFCSYSDERLGEQLGGWAAQGIPRVKMKVGREPARDPHRVSVARAAIGPDVELMVDANGAFAPAEAAEMARRFGEHGVRWFEEPLSSDDVAGLRELRRRVPDGMAVAAGEYATDAYGFDRLLDGQAVDVLQADVTRCGGFTGLLQADALCAAHDRDLSAHGAPILAVHGMAAARRARHIEYFHDHVRVERLLFDGVLEPQGGALVPDPARPGLGLELRRGDAERYRS